MIYWFFMFHLLELQTRLVYVCVLWFMYLPQVEILCVPNFNDILISLPVWKQKPNDQTD